MKKEEHRNSGFEEYYNSIKWCLLLAVFLVLAFHARARAETVDEMRANGVPASSAEATPVKGKVWVSTATNWFGLTIGPNGYVLTADSAEASGLKWAEGGTGGGAGTVTSVLTGNGLSGGPITETGTIELRLDANGTLSKTLGVGTNELGVASGSLLNVHIGNTAGIGWSKISKTGSSLADFDTRSASDLSSGTLPDGRFPGTLPVASGVNLTALNASNLGSGTIPDARFPATLPALSGVNLTALNASNLGSGTVPDARFPATLPAISGTNLTSLNATNISSGSLALNRLTLGTGLHYLRTNAGATAAEWVAFPSYEVPLTFSTGLTRVGDTITVNTTQNILKLSNLPSNGFVKTGGGDGTLAVDTSTYLTTAVTSVSLALPSSIFDVSGSPVTTTGTLTGTLDTQNANTVFAGPNTGTPDVPAFRALVTADLPTVSISKGGTGQVTQTAGFDALSPLTTQGDLIYHDGTDNIRLGKGTAGQVLTMNAGATAPEWADAASSGAPTNATYITQTANGTLSNEQALGSLATGIVKNTTTTGVLSIAVAGTDYQTPLTAGTNYEVPLTFSTGLTRSTNTITVNTTQNIAKLSNLTTNGFVKTSGGDGTLSVDTATYLATSSLGSGVATFLGTPSSANLRSALTDETGSGGSAVFSTSPTITGLTLSDLTTDGLLRVSGGGGTVSSIAVATVPLGGTGSGTHTTGGVLYGNGTNNIAATSAPADAGRFLGSSGSSPQFRAISGTSTKTANYTVVAGDSNKVISCNSGSGAFTITLTAAATLGDGFVVTILKTSADTATSTNAVTIDANSSETINGALTNRLQGQYSHVTLICDGTNWNVLSANDWIHARNTSLANIPTSNLFGDITQLDIPSGEWDTSCAVYCAINGATITSGCVLGISTTAGNSATGLTLGDNYHGMFAPTTVSGNSGSIPAYRVVLTSTTTHYLKFQATYSVATPQQVCRLSARRVK